MRREPRIAVVGEYAERKETHRATSAELAAAHVPFTWVSTETALNAAHSLKDFDGLWIAPGSPYTSMDGAIRAIRYAREASVPLVATCGGFQHVVLELARNLLGIERTPTMPRQIHKPSISR